MDLATFRDIVDSYVSGISACQNDPAALYAYIGLTIESHFARKTVEDALRDRIKAAFTSGHAAAQEQCYEWLDQLIQDHVIDGTPLDPYFSILYELTDALRSYTGVREEIHGDWLAAIHNAYDGITLNNWTPVAEMRERVHARTFEVAKAAKRLKAVGIPISRQGKRLYLDDAADDKVVKVLEAVISRMGGLNVARRIFEKIMPAYDSVQERYHIVARPQPSGGGVPNIPLGYLLMLAVKHFSGVKPCQNTDHNWDFLCHASTDFGALFDVQPYAPLYALWMDPLYLIRHLQELALYDTLYRLPQARPGDIIKIARKLLAGIGGTKTYGKGWTVDEALSVSEAILGFAPSHRGPIAIDRRLIKKACPQIAPEIVETLIDDVRTHPKTGANQNFTKPTDAPTSPSDEKGHDFFMRPLLSLDGKTTFLIDRSICAPAFLEALLSQLRQSHPNFDNALGTEIETFLRGEFLAHEIPTLTGTYHTTDGDGECDLVLETEDTIIFFEIKKKPLTRRARAGSDVHILTDLAKSLIDAQIQAGWHEVRLRRDGYLDLNHGGATTRLNLNDRQIERIAVSLLDFGSFQDRVLLERIFLSMAGTSFTPADPALQKDFTRLNKSLEDVRQQTAILSLRDAQWRFFNCWFLSVPQLLILLDGVTGPASFKNALWQTRSIVTGTNDLYHDIFWRRDLNAKVAASNSNPNSEIS